MGKFTVLASNILGVEAAGNSYIDSSFDDSAAIGEDGHLIWGGEEAEGELVGAYRGQFFEAEFEFGKIDWFRSFVNLNSVAAAKGNGRALFAVEVGKFRVRAAGGTVWVWVGLVDLADGTAPNVYCSNSETGLVAGKEFDRVSGLDGGNGGGDGAEDAGGFAGWLVGFWRW